MFYYPSQKKTVFCILYPKICKKRQATTVRRAGMVCRIVRAQILSLFYDDAKVSIFHV